MKARRTVSLGAALLAVGICFGQADNSQPAHQQQDVATETPALGIKGDIVGEQQPCAINPGVAVHKRASRTFKLRIAPDTRKPSQYDRKLLNG